VESKSSGRLRTKVTDPKQPGKRRGTRRTSTIEFGDINFSEKKIQPFQINELSERDSTPHEVFARVYINTA